MRNKFASSIVSWCFAALMIVLVVSLVKIVIWGMP